MPVGRPVEVRRTGVTPRSQGAQATRERIVHAAACGFDQRGYLGVNLKDVVDEIGLTKGALYYFFPSKVDLAVEIVNRHSAAWVPITSQACTPSGDPLDAVVEIGRRVARSLQIDPMARAATRLSIERHLIQAELPGPFDDWIAALSRLLQLAKSLGHIHADIDPIGTAEIVVAFCYGTQRISPDPEDQAGLVVKVDRFWASLLPSLRPPGARSEWV
jgi:AcrR family transcriptional regulator